jgi:nitroreductase
MCTITAVQKNQILDEILAARRTHRAFLPEVPAEEAIRQIIHAGLLAPYAALATGSSKDYFRRFLVMKNGSSTLAEAQALVLAQVKTMADSLNREMEQASPDRKAAGKAFAQRLAMFAERGMVPGIGTAPYYIVVAEWRGIPDVAPQSIAYCMENMWLKATVLGLGFQPVSITAQMADSREFCSLLGIEPGAWDLNGCAVGYPASPLPLAVRPPVDDVTSWLG